MFVVEQPVRFLPDNNLIRSSSFESIQDRKSPTNQAKLRTRACNDSFRQAVDKSYGQQMSVNKNHHVNQEENDEQSSNKIEKQQKFRFTNLFSSKSKRKQDENRSHIQPQSQGYQPYRFDASTSSSSNEQYSSPRYESHLVHTFQPKTISAKSTYPSIPRQFYHMNLNGSQSLKQRQTTSHTSILQPSTYPSTFTVQPTQFTAYSHNFDKSMPINQQQIRRTNIYPSPSRNFFHVESPANV